ncbi:glycosyltransferase [Phreatobacter sp.]|uniref:glycosyltransferase n=1 Tax=Phreatobacter sp. TaxID=1966341 RepID=UPI0022C03CB4|nr:glycosyltransferase [Phreatobacter sp.]MCZ8316884.1 glycosyltransferase [Phreatobacter sp.]
MLHIGNVANYAYNIAKVLQTDRIRSDAISWDYYHINARPIWEEGDFDASLAGDHFFPALPSGAEARFDEPDWYWHGPRRLACLGLIAHNEGHPRLAAMIRRMCERHLRRIADPSRRARDVERGDVRILEILAGDLLGGFGPADSPRQVQRWLNGRCWGRPLVPLAERFMAVATRRREGPVWEEAGAGAYFGGLVERLLSEYQTAWPDRAIDPMLLHQFASDIGLMRRLLKPYDVVIGYAIDGIWPLLAGRKYIAYEFGTIRNLPFEDNPMGQLASMVYRNSELTIVTNCDNEAPARRLGRPYRFLPHVINESGLIESRDGLRAELEARHGGSFYIFHPPRQHWDETRNTNWDKGNDKLFQALAILVHDRGLDARCIAVNWGATLASSKALISALGIERNVIWIEPQPHRRMMRWIAAADVVADQFTIPTFGGIPPKAFLAGRPVVTRFDPALHRWCFENLPPFLPASEPEEIASALQRLASDPAFAAELSARGRAWYRMENSNDRIRSILVDMVEKSVAA